MKRIVLGLALAWLGHAAAQGNAATGGSQGEEAKGRAQAPTYGGQSASQAGSRGQAGQTAAPAGDRGDQETAGPTAGGTAPSTAHPPGGIGTAPGAEPPPASTASPPADASGTGRRDQGFVVGNPFEEPGERPDGVAPPADRTRARATGEHALPIAEQPPGRNDPSGGTSGAEQRQNARPEPSASDRTGSGAPDPAAGQGSSAPSSPAGTTR